MDNRYIIIFDGVCNLCNGAVTFIINRDPDGVFLFTPMQSDLAKKLTVQHGIDNMELDTFLLIKNGRCYISADAALEIAKDLTGGWHFLGVFKLLPGPVRDIFYRAIARNRYKLLGRRSACMVPTKKNKSRFIGV